MAPSVMPAQSEQTVRTERRSSILAGPTPDRDRESELPDSYGHSRVVLLAVDPFHVHAYWEMTLPDRIRARELLSPLWESEAPTWVLRFYDVTSVDPEGGQARSTFDVAVSPSARNWYVELWSSDKSYFAELGPRLGEQFVPVCRSDVVRVPRSEPPPPREPEWQAMPAAPQGSGAESSGALPAVEPNVSLPVESLPVEQPAGVAQSQASDAARAAPARQGPPTIPERSVPLIPPPFPRHEPKSLFGDTRAFEAALRGAANGPLVGARGVSLIARRDTGSMSGRGSGGRWLGKTAEGGHGGSKA
jgi:hypothetical protein